jgi:hypothetical protein
MGVFRSFNRAVYRMINTGANEMSKHEFLLIESYALGYLAHKLDEYAPEGGFKPLPMQDMCFLELMKYNGVMTVIGCVISKSAKLDFEYYLRAYKMGYSDSLGGNASKVSIPHRQAMTKVWNYSTTITEMMGALQ